MKAFEALTLLLIQLLEKLKAYVKLYQSGKRIQIKQLTVDE